MKFRASPEPRGLRSKHQCLSTRRALCDDVCQHPSELIVIPELYEARISPVSSEVIEWFSHQGTRAVALIDDGVEPHPCSLWIIAISRENGHDHIGILVVTQVVNAAIVVALPLVWERVLGGRLYESGFGEGGERV